MIWGPPPGTDLGEPVPHAYLRSFIQLQGPEGSPASFLRMGTVLKLPQAFEVGSYAYSLTRILPLQVKPAFLLSYARKAPTALLHGRAPGHAAATSASVVRVGRLPPRLPLAQRRIPPQAPRASRPMPRAAGRVPTLCLKVADSGRVLPTLRSRVANRRNRLPGVTHEFGGRARPGGGGL